MPVSITSVMRRSYTERNWDFKSIMELKQLPPDKAQQKMLGLVMDLSCDLSRALQDIKALAEYCSYLENKVDRYARPDKPRVETYFSRVDHLGGIVSQRDTFEDHVHLVTNPGLREQKTDQ